MPAQINILDLLTDKAKKNYPKRHVLNLTQKLLQKQQLKQKQKKKNQRSKK